MSARDQRLDRLGPRVALAFALALGACSAAVADQDDERLIPLFEQLQQAPDAYAAALVEAEIWRVWLLSGDADVDGEMGEGIAAMAAGRLDLAIAAFDRVVQMAPGFAEGWNKRATAYYLVDRLPESVTDIQATLALEPRHFGALSGMGLIFLQSGDPRGALDAFEAVLALNPSSASARRHVEILREKLAPTGT